MSFLLQKFLFSTPLLLVLYLQLSSVNAGPYTNSAHGDNTIGVNRTVTRDDGYARGNCSHCHVQHSSISGAAPAPDDGANSFALYSRNFNTAKEIHPYTQEDNVCFSCHSFNASSGQSVVNYDYSSSFGCGGNSGETNILSTMNQLSYHNLFDIYTYAKNNFSWFTENSNPCNACHNPHLARDNAANPQDNSFAAISKPTDHFSLYGDDATETIGNNFGTSYEPVFCNDGKTTREPGGSNDAIAGRANQPDYIAFCTTCHTPTADIYSTTLGRNLRKIDWRDGGEKHGIQLTEGHINPPGNNNDDIIAKVGGGALLRPPYTIGGNYIVSCIDCHEPHGSPNVMLLRRRTNGGDLTAPITKMDNDMALGIEDRDDIGYLCMKCHYDDKGVNDDGLKAWGETADSVWRIVHHGDSIGWDSPFKSGTGDNNLSVGCGDLKCHGQGGLGFRRPKCSGCHYHGSEHTIIYGTERNEPDSTRKTF